MKLRVFTLQFAGGPSCFDDGPVREFIEDKEVIDVSEHFFIHDKTPYLTILLSYREAAPDERRKPFPRENPRNDLDEAEARTYDALRTWRAARARQEGIPPYLILNNSQLAKAVRTRVSSKADLMKIQGFGEVKAAGYGDEILRLLAEHLAPASVAKPDEKGG